MIKEFINFNIYIKVRLITSLIRRLSTDILIPFITIYLSIEFSPIVTGFIILSILILGTLFNLYGGILNQYIKTEYILKYGELLHFISVFMMLVFININSYIFIFLYLLKNIIFSFLIPFGESIVIENSCKLDRKKIYSIEYILLSVSLPLSMLVGVFLYHINIQLVIALSAILIFINSILYFKYFGRVSIINNRVNNISFSLKEYNIILENKNLLLILISAILFYSIEFSSLQLLPIYLVYVKENHGVDIFVIFRIINSLSVIVIGIFLFKYINNISSLKNIVFFMFIYLISFILLFYFNNNLLIFILLGIIVTLSNYIYSTYRKQMYMNNIDFSSKGISISAYSLTSRIGNIISSIILVIYSITNIYFISIWLFIVGIISIIIFFISSRKLSEE